MVKHMLYLQTSAECKSQPICSIFTGLPTVSINDLKHLARIEMTTERPAKTAGGRHRTPPHPPRMDGGGGGGGSTGLRLTFTTCSRLSAGVRHRRRTTQPQSLTCPSAASSDGREGATVRFDSRGYVMRIVEGEGKKERKKGKERIKEYKGQEEEERWGKKEEKALERKKITSSLPRRAGQTPWSLERAAPSQFVSWEGFLFFSG